MNQLDLIPTHLKEKSISQSEIVLPVAEALEAISFFEVQGTRILGWEGWIKDSQGHIGHRDAPQGTVSLNHLSFYEAAQLCRSSILDEATQWAHDNPNTSDVLYFCITAETNP